jgi:hypothetical protein
MKTYRTNLVLLTISITLLTILLFSCSSTQDAIQPSVLPPTGFSETGLIGKWKEDGIADSSETITLSADHKYHQTFDSLETNYHVELEGSWELQKSHKGCTYIYLYGQYLRQLRSSGRLKTWVNSAQASDLLKNVS